ncbi:unnamed protein product, partial [Oppiella nova]
SEEFVCQAGGCQCSPNSELIEDSYGCKPNGCRNSSDCLKCSSRKWCARKTDGCYCSDSLYDQELNGSQLSGIVVQNDVTPSI